MKGRKRIQQFEGLRFIMCIIVIISHLEFLRASILFGTVYVKYFHNPTLAVDYFFMLSGFGMFLSTKRPKKVFKRILDFATSKIWKIYPAYLFSLVISLPYNLYVLFYNYNEVWKNFLKFLTFCGIDLILLQSSFGMNSLSTSLNGVCWFLSTLFVCYLLSPYLLYFVDKLRSYSQIFSMILLFLTLILSLSCLSSYIESRKIFGGLINDLWYTSPLIRIWYLGIGMCIGSLYKKWNKKVKFKNISEFTLTVVAFCYFLGRNSLLLDRTFLRFFDVILCTVLMIVFSAGEGKITGFLKSQKMVNLGKLSMLLYLFHYPVRMTIGIIFSELGVTNYLGELGYVIEIALIVLVTCLVLKLYQMTFKLYSSKHG